MLKIQIMTLGANQTNTYIVHAAGSRTCCVVDPGYEPRFILDTLKDLGLTLEAILLTHGHFDHVGGVKMLVDETGCRVFLCKEDLQLPDMWTGGPLYYTDTYGEGSILHLAGLDIQVMHTPGHTPGSVCLLTENGLFSGDTLFPSSCGRTDLPGGSAEQLRASLARLAALDGNYFVYPGHGCNTSLHEEKQYNPYLK